jgi:hypothetical protein
MLARSGPIPRRGGYAYEVKWDGFRAIVATEDGIAVRSRRGWNMTELVPELDRLPSGLVLDGELVAFGDDGRPSFPLLSQRMLMKRALIPVVLMVFDVLRVEGEDAIEPSGVASRATAPVSCPPRSAPTTSTLSLMKSAPCRVHQVAEVGDGRSTTPS